MDVSENVVINALKSKNDGEAVSTLRSYIHMLENQPSMLHPGKSGERQELTGLVIEKLYNLTDENFVKEALAYLRFMSRDKDIVAKHMADAKFSSLLLAYGKLGRANSGQPILECGDEAELNACRCLSNVIFQTRDVQNLCSNGAFIRSILNHIQNHKLRSHEQNVLPLRFIFLVSALNAEGRKKLNEHEARKIVLDYLRYILQEDKDEPTSQVRPSENMSKEDTNMCNEILKVLFNLNMDLRRSAIFSQQELMELVTTVELCSIVLMSKSVDSTLTEGLHCNTGNAIYSVPPACFNVDKLIGTRANHSEPNESLNMEPVVSLLNILRNRIMTDKISNDVLHPLFALLSHLCRLSRDIRVYVKNEIMPPRKDFKRRPEEGRELRHKLIKLFTHNNTDIKHGAADFLFVLCKEKVDRLVKYTGYGNAAGLLALRGLLAGGHGETVYSDTDSDSDTEEYKEVSDVLNPVTGHVPPKLPNPMEGMSDEQKEYLAVELANQISKLSSNDVLQPVCVGEDGKLIPLQQKVHETKLAQEAGSSDDD